MARSYYVSCVDGERRALVCGPYPTHEQALADVHRVSVAAAERWPESWWYSWGTAGSDTHSEPGVLGLPADLEKSTADPSRIRRTGRSRKA